MPVSAPPFRPPPLRPLGRAERLPAGVRPSRSVPRTIARPLRAPGRSLQPQLLSGLLVWVAAALIFCLVWSNANPQISSSCIWSTICAVIIILARGPLQTLRAALSERCRTITLLLVLLFLATGISAMQDLSKVTAEAVLFRTILPLAIYFSLVGVAITRRGLRILYWTIAVACGIALVRGILAFIAEWGIPDFDTLIWARTNEIRIAGYENATFGHVNHMGEYLALIIPILIFGLGSLARSLAGRAAIAAVTLLGIVNLLICGSRTGMITIIGCATLWYFRGRLQASRVALAVVLAAALVPAIASETLPSYVVNRFVPALGSEGYDSNADERFQSMVIGWNTFADHPVIGVGPDMSPKYNVWDIPHQSLIYVLSEIGLIGGGVFLALNLLVMWQAFLAVRRSDVTWTDASRKIWLIGPACWFFFGTIGGISFNMQGALLWIGIVHACLALASAEVVAETPPVASKTYIVRA